MAKPTTAPFDLEKFGTFETELPRLFPYKPKRGSNIFFPATPDPTGAGQRAVDFLSNFKIPEGRAVGRRIEGDNLPPFIRRAVEVLIGHRDPLTHTRYIRNAFFCAPRKSMKSYLSALLGVLFLFSKQEYAGEILIVASSQRQARRIFELVCAIIKSNPKLFSSLRVQDINARLTNLSTGTTLSAVASDPAKLYGLSPSVLLLDELHTWTGDKGHKLWTSLTTGQGARANPLTVVTSTVPDDVPDTGSVFLEQLRYAQSVFQGDTDDRRFLPMLWLTPEDARISDKRIWKKYNPGAGYSISLDEMKEEYDRAATSDTGLAGFRTMRLNQIAKSSLDQGWLTPAMLERISGDERINPADMTDAPTLALGLDYGGAWDFASLVIVADDPDDGMVAVQRSWVCQDGYDRIAAAVPEVKDMVARGELTISGGEAVSVQTVVDDVADLAAYFGLKEIALDVAMSQHLAPGLKDAGIEIVVARQGTMSMAAPMTLLEELISEDRFRIGSDKLFKWCLGNTAQMSNTMGRKPVKIGVDNSANPRKIDVTSALLSALQLVQEARVSAPDEDDGCWVCPYTDPVNASAMLLDDGAYFGNPYYGDEKVHPKTGGVIVYGG